MAIRSMTPRSAKPQLQTIFEDRTQTVYSSMRGRVAEKRNKNGVVIRVGREIPFSLQEFREWVLDQFGPMGWNGVVRCTYCTEILNVQNVVLDHATPISSPWNGSLGLENLVCACAVCNRRKGGCSRAGFTKLFEFLVTLDSRDAGDILSRLATGGEGAKLLWQRKAFKRKAG